jgi:hypothetical protein
MLQSAINPTAQSQAVQTVLRIRPFLAGEQEAADDYKCVRRVDESSIEIFNARCSTECFRYKCVRSLIIWTNNLIRNAQL